MTEIGAHDSERDRTLATLNNAYWFLCHQALGDVVGAFKSLTTHRYVIGVRNHGWPWFQRRLWQRNYYEHIIRNAGELKQVRQYIADNPAQWVVDRENPDRSVGDTAGKPDERDDIAKLFGGVRP